MYTSETKAEKAYAAYRGKKHDSRPHGADGKARFSYQKKG